MKQPKKPTYWQKKKMSKAGLDWHKWMVRRQSDTAITLVNKDTGEVKELEL